MVLEVSVHYVITSASQQGWLENSRRLRYRRSRQLLVQLFAGRVGILINSFGINYHQFADDNCTPLSAPDSPHFLASLTLCTDAVTAWHIRNNLLLNPSKTLALVAGTHRQIAELDTSNEIAVSGSIRPLSSKQRVLGVTLDEKLTFDDHISGIVRSCNYHLRNLRHIPPLVDQDSRTPLTPLRVRWCARYRTTATYSLWSHEAKHRPSPACPEFARSRRVFSTIQIARFTSSSPPVLAPSKGTNNIQDRDVDL